MTQPLIRRLIEKIASAPINSIPSDNIYMEDVFTPEIYQEILARLPSDHEYEWIGHPDAMMSDGRITRKMLDLTDASIKRMKPQHHNFWRQIKSVLISKDTQRALCEKFREKIESRFGNDWPEIVSVPVFYRDFPGYKISIHPDTHHKIATLQFYFPRDNSQIHLGTSFHVKEGETYTKHKTNLFKPNSAYAFARSDCSWHSVDEMGAHETPRDTLALTLYMKGHEYVSQNNVPPSFIAKLKNLLRPILKELHLR